MARHPVFDEDSRLIDQFGWLTVISIAAIVLLMLINIDPEFTGLLSRWESVVASLLVGVTLLLALRASGLARRYQRIADIAVLVVVTAVLVLAFLDTVGAPIRAAGPAPWFIVILSVLAPIAVIVRLVRHREITRGTLFGAISGYLLIALTFFYLFLAVAELDDGRFFDERQPTQSFMYFSLTTITTTGYGDLTAATDVGRLFATSEAVIGQIYLVTFVAMLVGLFVAGRRTMRLTGDPDASGSSSSDE